MNGRQRARWAADIITDLQRLQKRARGRLDAPGLARALTELAAARAAALAERTNDEEGDDDGSSR